MKKLIIVALCALVFGAVATAQPRALGVRVGYGAEVSYQHSVGSNFIEADLGFLGGAGFSVAGIYNFKLGEASGFNFYAGPGAQLAFAQAYDAVNDRNYLALGVAVAGQIGVEYPIPSIPLTFSFDWRPAFYFTGASGFGWSGFGLGIRYRF